MKALKSKGKRAAINEYNKALEYQIDNVWVVVSNLERIPKLAYIENPIAKLCLTPKEQTATQVNYYSENVVW